MAKHNVNIDIILQSVGRDNKKSISFTIRQDDAERVEKILRDAKEMLGYEDISINTKVAKVFHCWRRHGFRYRRCFQDVRGSGKRRHQHPHDLHL